MPLILLLFKRFFKCIFQQREKEGEREGNISVWLPLTCPLQGTCPATQVCDPTGNQLVTLWFAGQHSVNLATPAKAANHNSYVCKGFPPSPSLSPFFQQLIGKTLNTRIANRNEIWFLSL